MEDIRKVLDKLVKDEWLWSYTLSDDELVLQYGLYSVRDTERVVDLTDKTLTQAIRESANNIRVDIESSLVDEDDYFDYENKEQLEERIVEETEYLIRLCEVIEECE